MGSVHGGVRASNTFTHKVFKMYGYTYKAPRYNAGRDRFDAKREEFCAAELRRAAEGSGGGAA